MIAENNVTTFFFDFGDTLVEGEPTYLRRVTNLLGDFGFECEYPEVVQAFTRADYLLYLDASSGTLASDEEYLMRFLDHFGECLEISVDWPAILPQMTRKFEEMEVQGLTEDELIEFGTGKLRLAAVEGDMTAGSFMAGQSCGLVKDTVPVAEVIQRIISEAEGLLHRLPRYVNTGNLPSSSRRGDTQ